MVTDEGEGNTLGWDSPSRSILQYYAASPLVISRPRGELVFVCDLTWLGLPYTSDV